MKRSRLIQVCLAFGLLIFVLQTGKAQLSDKSIKGKYVGKSLREELYSNIRVKKNHTYSLRKFTATGKVIEKTRGKWQLEGTYLVLMPDNQGPELKLMASGGQWFAVGKQGFSFEAVYTQYKRRGLVYRKTKETVQNGEAQVNQGGR